jgi:exopolysaccharide biosynthesis WecB/TagA/CpsF family protein
VQVATPHMALRSFSAYAHDYAVDYADEYETVSESELEVIEGGRQGTYEPPFFESGERPIVSLPPRESFLRLKQAPPSFAAQVDCMGIPVANGTWQQIREWFFASALSRGREPRVMYFANAHTCNVAWSDPEFRAVLSRADLVLNDGIGVEIYARLAGVRFNQNFNGTDLFPRLFAEATPHTELRVFLYGAEKGRAAKAAKNIEARFPNVRVVGTLDGFARGESVIEAINEACADVLLVGMGNPIQERWIDENRDLLDVGIVAGVGALIDFLSGEVARAPSWVRSLRCEWLYRLAREPKRLFKRYMMGNPAFLARSVAYLGLGIAPRELPF